MLAAAVRPDLVGALRPAARGALAEFAALITTFRESAREAAVDELLVEVVEGIRYDEYLRAEGPESADRLDNVRELVNGAREQVADEEGEVGLTPLDHFLQRAMLVAELDKLGPDADAVTLMTLHNAKGLEFPVVFITGLEDGLFPLAKAYDDPALLEEERRLFYVGITRAERKLFLTHAEERRRNGEFMPSKASSFLQAIPEDMLEQRKTIKVRSSRRSFMHSLGGGSQWGNSRKRPGLADQVLRTAVLDDIADFPPSAAARRPGTPVVRSPSFDEADVSQDAAVIVVGARVRHRKFGSGVIAELAGAGRDLKAKIDFDDQAIGRKTLVVAQANLERDID
jgi:DNA helicase-2/ATP-dependent DNA helicase PcrA